MTDEQKLQWLKEVLANGINVAQINLGDGIQNIQMNAYGQMQGVPRHEDEKAQASPSQEKPEQPLASSNIVFNPRLFTSEAHYEHLRETIFAFVKHDGEETADDLYQIVPDTQAEWYYVLKGIDEAGVAGSQKLTTINFLRQMLAWYPSFFIKKSEQEDTAKMLRRYASSISAERNKWVAGMEKRETSIHDMFAISNTLGYDKAKTLRLHGVAAGLKKHLEKLLQEITKQGK